jgi:hypothetical protein
MDYQDLALYENDMHPHYRLIHTAHLGKMLMQCYFLEILKMITVLHGEGYLD